MNVKSMCISCVLVLFSVIGSAQRSTNKPVLISQNLIYVLLSNDTAYYMWRHFDKPSSFAERDTLIYKDGIYRGLITTLQKTDRGYNLEFNGGVFKGRNLRLKISNKRQINRWHLWHNNDRYNSHISNVNLLKNAYSNDRIKYDTLEKEWQQLFMLMDKIDKYAYEEKMNSFLKKHLIE